MSRMISLIVLVVILIAIAIMFFDVMSSFILPIFLALLLVVMFRPLQQWVLGKCKGHVRIAAGLTTLSILFIALIPLVLILLLATLQAIAYFYPEEDEHLADNRAVQTKPLADSKVAQDAADGEKQPGSRPIEVVTERAAEEIANFGNHFSLSLTPEYTRAEVVKPIISKLKSWIAPLALGTTHFIVRFIVGLCVMVIALYYFFADGPAMMDSIMRLSPLDTVYVKQLIEEFDKSSRAVVLATLISAVAQGLLAGMGYYFAGLDNVFLLTFLTMLMAMIPFVGSTGVWLPVCLWLHFYAGHTGAAIGLFIYGALVVSLIDNLLKPFILHGSANLHPLLALLSVLGGVEALGPIGIFVGPMVVSFMQALLVMLQKELERMRLKEPGLAGKGF